MGWIKDAKNSSMAADAQAAWDEGSTYFTPMLNVPTFKSSYSGRVKDWEGMLSAITDVGSRLEHWAVASDSSGRPQAMPLFVRS